MYDLIIKGGLVVDFDTDELVNRDIGIKDGKIISIERELRTGDNYINADGQIVSPGFIDIHMHEETIGNTADGDDYDIANKMLLMGVTTCVGGNCGNNRMKIFDYFKFVDENGAPVNYLLFTGHNYYRNLLGVDRYSSPNEEQLEKMIELIETDISEYGAVGLSFGIEYSPGITFEEIISICDTIKDYDILLSAHYRADASKGIESIKELIKISELTGLPMQISHIGSCVAMGQMRGALDVIKDAIDNGLSITADCYPYDAFSTYIGSTVFDEGCFENWGRDYDSILLTEEPYKNIKCTKEIFHKVREEYPNMLVVAFVMNEEEIIEALKEPFVYVASDGILNCGQGHPRAAGTFPKVIGKWVRDEKKLELIDQLKKMSKLPANRLKLEEKGEIRTGMDADIVVFDYNKIIDNASFDNPTEPPTGINYVIIDGKVAVENGEIVNKRLGKSIRRVQN